MSSDQQGGPPPRPVPSTEAMTDAVRVLLDGLGDDTRREGLQDTPARHLKALRHFTSGYGKHPLEALRTADGSHGFADGAPEDFNALVVQTNIRVWSLCEHHLLPFFGVAHIGYVPNGRIVGLSKFKRLVEIFARRFQVQERLGCQIADALMEHVKPLGVGVVLECRHTCMESRGIEEPGTVTVTSALRGLFLEGALRAEFLNLAKRGSRPL